MEYHAYVRKLFLEPSKILHKVARRVTKDDLNDVLFMQLANDMAETMYANNGVGLAAPQVGESKRLIVVDVPLPEELRKKQLGVPRAIAMANPEITVNAGSELVAMREGCLSLPGVQVNVYRDTMIHVKFLEIGQRKVMEFDAEGILARIIQHEVDHLDGVLILDKVAKTPTPDELRELSKDELTRKFPQEEILA